MLVLTRRVHEALIIELPNGETIKVTVTGVNGNQVRLGTEAPQEIHVCREELLERHKLYFHDAVMHP